MPCLVSLQGGVSLRLCIGVNFYVRSHLPKNSTSVTGYRESVTRYNKAQKESLASHLDLVIYKKGFQGCSQTYLVCIPKILQQL